MERYWKIRQRITALQEKARAALAIAAARRLMNEHLRRPEESRSPFTLSLADVVVKLEEAITHPSADRDLELEIRRKEYYAGPYCHKLGKDALRGASEDAASATIYAIGAYCTHSKEEAASAAMQLIDSADARVGSICLAQGIDGMSKEADGMVSRLEDIELDRLDRAVSLLEKGGSSSERTLSDLMSILTG